MEYIASHQLANILMAYGFIENTIIRYPEQRKRMETDGYMPAIMKRSFRFGHKVMMVFDYEDIILYHNNFSIFHQCQISERDLAALLTFVQLSPRTRNAWLESRRSPLEIADHYDWIREHPKLATERRDQFIEMKFKEVLSALRHL